MTSAYAADPVFESNPKLINNLIQRIHDRDVALPDFQRDFVWDSRATMELLRSVMSRFPAGTLLFWKQSTELIFAAREFDGAPILNGHTPDELVLDGQQRLTSLYRALTGSTDERYFARLTDFIGSDGDVLEVHEINFDSALACYDLSGNLKFDPTSRDYQFENHLFPLEDISKFDEWLDDYARRNETDADPESQIKRRMRALRDSYLVPLRSYGFPVVTLPATTPLEAVCNIFETLNRTGKPLGAFDLVTARLFPKKIRMRDLWDEAVQAYPLFEDYGIEPYSLLQAVSLRARNSAQRADVLTKITAEDISEHWQPVVTGTADVLDMLRTEHGVIARRWLPYSMLLVPMAAVWQEIAALKPLERSGALDRLSRYFWCTTFMTNFDQGANSQAGADYIKLKEWLHNKEAAAPEAVDSFQLTDSTLLRANVRRKALHAGIMALTTKSGAKDFHSAQKISPQRAIDRRIDSHHIFPKAFLNDTKYSELILNRALIDSETNKIIGRKAPSQYFQSITAVHDKDKVLAVLESHAIDASPSSGILNDDYDLFLRQRLSAMVELIEDATKSHVIRENNSE
ncbi:GmrSD restriction endonuclease domain-containing protein [Rhodococcus sp. NPDC004095]